MAHIESCSRNQAFARLVELSRRAKASALLEVRHPSGSKLAGQLLGSSTSASMSETVEDSRFGVEFSVKALGAFRVSTEMKLLSQQPGC